jgi:hypothetical protein
LFPTGIVLQPGQTLLVICDSNPAQGPMHANFKIDKDGDRVYLQKRTETGAFVTVDAVQVPPLGPDQAYSRMGARGGWEIAQATPEAPNIADDKIRLRVRTRPSGRELALVFPVTPGAPYAIESGSSGNGPWTVIAAGIGTEIAGTFVHSIQPSDSIRFFRVRSN